MVDSDIRVQFRNFVFNCGTPFDEKAVNKMCFFSHARIV